MHMYPRMRTTRLQMCGEWPQDRFASKTYSTVHYAQNTCGRPLSPPRRPEGPLPGVLSVSGPLDNWLDSTSTALMHRPGHALRGMPQGGVSTICTVPKSRGASRRRSFASWESTGTLRLSTHWAAVVTRKQHQLYVRLPHAVRAMPHTPLHTV